MKTGRNFPKFEPTEGAARDLLVVLNTQVGDMPSSNDSDLRLRTGCLFIMYEMFGFLIIVLF